ncbi:MAG: ISKra4 family transposase [Chitinophagales bacterium]|nr:ISKra4 family transposase [Chitinophagales bacterium]
MNTRIIEENSQGIKLEIYIPYSNSMLQNEETIQRELNNAGNIATEKSLKQFDTDGSSLKIGSVKYTSKGQVESIYQTPYGEIRIKRHVYQTKEGGSTYCPLESNARIIHSTTPKFAKIVGSKYGRMDGPGVVKDLKEHGRDITKGYIQNLTEIVSTIAYAKEGKWEYEVPEYKSGVSCISIGMDGSMVLVSGEGYREVMTGTIAFFDKDCNRLYTKYIAATPEYQKETFKSRMEKEISQVKSVYPNAVYVGLADGGNGNWEFLSKHTDIQTIDFYHVTEYLSNFSDIIFENELDKKKWLKEKCHQLKHEDGAADSILSELKKLSKGKKGKTMQNLQKTITYFENQKDKMIYSYNIKNNLPIGSGITEAGCKVIVKERFCRSGMRWGKQGIAIVLKLRTMLYTTNQWEEFWHKIDRLGGSLN